jgi:hypothetical protein
VHEKEGMLESQDENEFTKGNFNVVETGHWAKSKMMMKTCA